jgi:cytidine deaminase
MLEIITYTMYLITITDIETANVEVHRLVFDNHAECLALAKAINQVRDPISTKKNCRRVINYYSELP